MRAHNLAIISAATIAATNEYSLRIDQSQQKRERGRRNLKTYRVNSRGELV